MVASGGRNGVSGADIDEGLIGFDETELDQIMVGFERWAWTAVTAARPDWARAV
jgi:hypothetical protein